MLSSYRLMLLFSSLLLLNSCDELTPETSYSVRIYNNSSVPVWLSYETQEPLAYNGQVRDTFYIYPNNFDGWASTDQRELFNFEFSTTEINLPKMDQEIFNSYFKELKIYKSDSKGSDTSVCIKKDVMMNFNNYEDYSNTREEFQDIHYIHFYVTDEKIK